MPEKAQWFKSRFDRVAHVWVPDGGVWRKACRHGQRGLASLGTWGHHLLPPPADCPRCRTCARREPADA